MIFIIILLITAAVCLALFQPRRAITAAAARHGLAIISAIIATATAVVIRLRRLCHVYLGVLAAEEELPSGRRLQVRV